MTEQSYFSGQDEFQSSHSHRLLFVQQPAYNPTGPPAAKRPSVVMHFQGVFKILTTCALAALAAVSAASAQTSTLTIDGYFDRGYTVTNNSNAEKNLKAVTNSAGTNTIGIKGSEDLGGGLKTSFSINNDWSDAAGATQSGAAPAGTASGFTNGQTYVDLSSVDYGTLRLGNINNEVLVTTIAVASPAFGTAIGSAYTGAFTIHNGFATTGGANVVKTGAIAIDSNTGVRAIRLNNTAKYITPTIAGFSAVVAVSPKNDNATTAAGGNTVGSTEMSASYAAGPVQVVYSSIKYDVGNKSVPANDTGLTAGSTNTHSILGASYQVMPSLKLHAGFGRSTSSLAAYNSASQQYGVTYTLTPVITLMAQYAKVNDRSATNIDRTLLGLGADYNFSKTARAYFRYEDVNSNSNMVAAGSVANKQSRTAVGISKAF